MRRGFLALLALSFAPALAPSTAAAGDTLVPDPKVPLRFNRLYDYGQLAEAMRQLAAAHPEVLTLSSLGKSVEGRDLWCMTINDPRTGRDRDKPAMYCDGNVHGNEVQAAEACLYLIWYLAENRERVPKIKELLAEKVFYVVPTVNPDGREFWFHGPNTTNSSRSGKAPLDDDRDGLADEDGYDDIDGDGQITQMRRKDPKGRFKVSSDDPRLLVPAKQGEAGEYELLGLEGIDNDGDGLVNEDPPGGYDMNRNYPADWQPNHIQFGAGPYPLCWPETKAVATFVLDHPNIAGVQSFHNAGGMILRGPGHPSRQAQYPAEDDRIAESIGAVGARMIPFYRNLVIHKDLYGVHGGFVNWTYEHLGIFSFTNELWNNDQMLGRAAAAAGGSSLADAVGATRENDQLFATDRLLQGSNYVPWKPAKHPLYGDIEIGGFVKQAQRVPPSFLLEELCHRNAAFVIYHADQAPRVAWEDVGFERVAPDTFAVTVALKNTRSIPTISQQARNRRVGPPDTLEIAGAGLAVLAGGDLVNRDTGEVRLVEREPNRLQLPAGIPGESTVRHRWFVRGPGVATIRYQGQKGGILTKTLELK